MKRLAGVLAAAAAGWMAGGCGPWLERPFAGLRDLGSGVEDGPFVERFEPPIPCGVGPYPSRGVQGEDTVQIGSVDFGGLGYRYGPERFRPGAPPLTVPIEVPPRLRVVIEVPPDRRTSVGIDNAAVPPTRPELAHRAMRCETGELARVFTVTFVLDGPQCVPLSVTHRYRSVTQVIPFGVRRCPPPDQPGP